MNLKVRLSFRLAVRKGKNLRSAYAAVTSHGNGYGTRAPIFYEVWWRIQTRQADLI
jgi:hypothetical protein